MTTAILLLCILPLAAACFTACVQSLRASHAVTLAVAAAHLGATLWFLGRPNPFPEGAWFAIDPLARFFLFVLSHTFFAVVICSRDFLAGMAGGQYQASRRLFYPALNFYLLANTLVIIAQHFGLIWVVLELTTFSLAPLIYFYRSKEALEAAWKYLFLVSLGLVFLLVGILFLGLSAKAAPGHPGLLVVDLSRHAAELDPLWLKAGFVLALLGISAKIGLAPMHPADIDATSNSPAPVAALMAGSLRSTAVLVLLRFFVIIHASAVHAFAEHLLMIAGTFSLLVAAVYIWRARNYKRLLAYSSVEHLGIITLAFGVGGVAMLGALLHTLFNSFGKLALFIMAGRIRREYQALEIDSIRGLLQRMPWTGFVFGLAFLYIVGTPPSGLFFSELMILMGMVHAGNWIVLASFLSLLMIVFIGMGRAVLRMLQRPAEEGAGQAAASGERFCLVHAVNLYAMLISIPIAIFQPRFLFSPLQAILAEFGFHL